MHPTDHAASPSGDDAAGRPNTTHTGRGTGDPRLEISSEGIHHTFALTADLVRIGSSPDCELQLDGVDKLHAEILHGPDDEYVLVMRGGPQASEGAAALKTTGEVLRAGDLFVLGPWRFVFVRADSAEHVRPGSRHEGDDPARRQPQPSRSGYTRLHPTSEENARAHAMGTARTEE